jgi:G:T-mismatch repair DNA endonuclease (very short patch repair protein)
MLRRAGWRVVRIWECALGQRAGAAVKRIANELQMVWPRKNAKSTKE